MNEQEIIEGNKLIAEFMGVQVVLCNGDLCHYKTMFEVAYHYSWDWLMPVVEKIESEEIDLNLSVVIKNNKCGIYRHKSTPYEHQLIIRNEADKTTAVWLAVLDFIKYYNSHFSPTPITDLLQP